MHKYSSWFQEIGNRMTKLFQLADELKGLHSLLGENDNTVDQLQTHVSNGNYVFFQFELLNSPLEPKIVVIL